MSAAAEGQPRSAGAGRSGRGWKGWLKIAVAVSLLAYVFSNLPYQDRLRWTADGKTLAVPGTIEGDWRADAIAFRLAESASTPAGWPAAEVLRLEAGEALSVLRMGSGEERGHGWEPGMPRVFTDVETGWLLIAFGLLSTAIMGGITRWWRLLAVASCPTSWWNTLRLTFLGLFFNLVMPGLTGGDMVKAVIVVRENPQARARALVSVAVDRLIGLVALLALAAAVILAKGDTFAEIRLPVLGGLVFAVVGAAVYFNGTLRRLVHFDALLERLPLGDKLRMIDDAVVLYARHPYELGLAVLLSLWNHFFAILGVAALGQAFGVTLADVSLGDWFALVPIANIVASLPVAPGGWGLGEATYQFLFELIGASGTLGVAVSVSFRLCQVVLSLIGGLFLLAPGAQLDLEQVEAEAEAATG